LDSRIRVLVVDPATEPLDDGRVRRVACDHRAFDFSPWTARPYGPALLGFELPLSDRLFELARRAQRTVVEFPEDDAWPHGRDAFNELLSHTRVETRPRENVAGLTASSTV
jgi:hypothetical protein